MKKAIVIVFEEDVYNSLFETVFEDLKALKNVYFVCEKAFPENGVYRILPSRKLKKLSCGLSNKLYCYYYNLPILLNQLKKEYDHISVLMHNASLRKTKYPIELLRELKKTASFNLLYLDVRAHHWVCSYANYLAEQGVFDRLLTIDPDDAQEYDMLLCNTPYSEKKYQQKNYEIDNQIYYCGTDSGRMFLLYRVWQEAKNRGITVKYNLSFADSFIDFFENDHNISFTRFLPYEEVVENVLKSTCILDITQAGQSALTMRPYEAVVYNKKLLTNNKNILNFKYYNSKYMQYFEKVEEINWDWVNNSTDVDYKYQGEFSPIYLLEKLA